MTPPLHLARLLPPSTVLLAVLLAGCGDNAQPARGGRDDKPITVTTTVVEERTWRDRIEALGTASANESVVITAKVTETVDAIRARLSDRVITAPFAGVLGFRQVSPGTLVTPGTAIATLDDISLIKLDFSVPERFLSSIAAGQDVTARSAAWGDREFSGKVTSVGSRVDPVTRAVQVRAEIPNPDGRLRPGMLMSVQLYEPERRTVVIPEIAVTQIGSRAFVYRMSGEGTVDQVDVVTGARRRGEVEVVEGLEPGERIVVDGTVKLRPGARVVDTGAADGSSGTAAAR